MEKVIYLEPDDEITTVIDKIRKITQTRAILVVPKAATILQSIVNLKILKKEALRMGKHISIVTSDETGRNLASQIGLDVYRDLAKRPLPESEQPKPPPEEIAAPKEDISKTRKSITPIIAAIAKDEKDEKMTSIKEEIAVPKPEPSELKGAIDISPSGVKFKPYKDERRAGIGAETILPKPSIKPTRKPKDSSLRKLKITAIILAIVALLVAAAAYFLLPKADINLVLKAEKIDKNMEIIAQRGAVKNAEAGIIPAEEQAAEKEISKDFPATGTKDVGEKAKGTITAINETGVDQPLVAQTRFQSPAGLIFRSTAGVTIPKAYLDPGGNKVNGSVNVSVIADASGEAYNIGPANFTIPGLPSSIQNKVYGRSNAAMSGGSTRKVKVVSEADVAKAQTEVLAEIVSAGQEEITKKAGEDQMILPGSSAGVVITSASIPGVGSEAETFKFTMKAKADILTVKKSDFYGVIEERINKEIPKDKELLNGELEKNTDAKVVLLDIANGKMVIAANVHAPVVAKMDTQVMKDNLHNKSANDAVSYLKSFTEVYDAQVTLWPFYARRVPFSSNRIYINTSYHL